MATQKIIYDAIIVGAGTAGCLLAKRLSADPQRRVLLLEAGGRDDYHWIHIPVGYLYCIGNPRTDWLFKTEPDAGLNGRSLRYPRGKVLGGSTAINGMVAIRGQVSSPLAPAEPCTMNVSMPPLLLLTMPGLPKEPSSTSIDVDDDGRIVGLF